MKCEAYAMAKITGEWVEEPTDAMLIGSYVDSYFEGTLDDFKIRNPRIFKKDGTLLKSYVNAKNIIRRIEADELFSLCMSGQKQVIMTFELFGVQWKIKIDNYIPDEAIVDLKVIKKIREIFMSYGGKITFIEKWGYDLQGAIYQEGVRQNTDQTLDFIIAAADKQEIPDIECILVPNDQLEFQKEKLRWKMPRIIDVKNHNEEPLRCGLCDYCRATKKLTGLIRPEQLLHR
jgi:hypothetical protein